MATEAMRAKDMLACFNANRDLRRNFFVGLMVFDFANRADSVISCFQNVRVCLVCQKVFTSLIRILHLENEATKGVGSAKFAFVELVDIKYIFSPKHVSAKIRD